MIPMGKSPRDGKAERLADYQRKNSVYLSPHLGNRGDDKTLIRFQGREYLCRVTSPDSGRRVTYSFHESPFSSYAPSLDDNINSRYQITIISRFA